MNAEILSVGTELLMGSTVNTDASELSKRLSELGINVFWHSVVGDNPERLAESLALARQRADLIITTGGLGPTCDDLTKQTLARSFGLRLVRDKTAEQRLREYFRAFKREMPETNLQQCLLPEGCTPFYNSCGTAPGCALESGDAVVIMLPGPPRECITMFEESAVPYLRKFSEDEICSHMLSIFGRGESDVESVLRDYMNELQNPTLAPYAKEGEVQLRVTAKAKTRALAEEMMKPVIARVYETIGDAIYGMDVDSLEQCVINLLREKKKTLACAESCTGGLVSARLTDIEGASEVFLGGAVVYTNEVKKLFADVSEKTLSNCGAVSAEVAAELAAGIKARLKTDYGIGITGLAGPQGDGKNAVGTVFVALAAEDGVFVQPLSLGEKSGRARIRTTAANYALDMQRRHLLGLQVVSV